MSEVIVVAGANGRRGRRLLPKLKARGRELGLAPASLRELLR
jgi:hypothetical protein